VSNDASDEKKAPASAAAAASVVDNDDTATAVFLACAGTCSETLLVAVLPLVDAADCATILAGFSKAIVAMVPMAGR